MKLTQKPLFFKIAALSAVLGLVASVSQAQTTVNAGFVGGSTIRNDGANSGVNASGSNLLIVGHIAGTGNSRWLRGALQFNVADLAIPQGAVVQSVKLVMTINEKDEQTSIPANLNVGLHAVTQDFNPSLVSWTNAANASGGNPATAWTTPGGVFDSNALASQVIASTTPLGTYTFESAALTALVQQSLSSGDSLVNLLLKVDSESDITRELLRFALSGATGPKLEITYAPIPEPSHVGLAIGAGALALICIRRRIKRS